MANIRELKVLSGQTLTDFQIVDGSPTGRERLSFITAGGTLGGSTITIKQELVFHDGSTSPTLAVPDPLAIITAPTAVEYAVGKNNNIYIDVTPAPTETIYIKVDVIN